MLSFFLSLSLSIQLIFSLCVCSTSTITGSIALVQVVFQCLFSSSSNSSSLATPLTTKRVLTPPTKYYMHNVYDHKTFSSHFPFASIIQLLATTIIWWHISGEEHKNSKRFYYFFATILQFSQYAVILLFSLVCFVLSQFSLFLYSRSSNKYQFSVATVANIKQQVVLGYEFRLQ